MQTELHEKRAWLSKERFLDLLCHSRVVGNLIAVGTLDARLRGHDTVKLEGLALVNMLPGGAVTQLAIFIGCDRAGCRCGVLAKYLEGGPTAGSAPDLGLFRIRPRFLVAVSAGRLRPPSRRLFLL